MNAKTYKEWWNSIDDYLAHMLMKEGYDHNKVYNIGVTELRAAGEEDKQMTMDEFVEFICRKTGIPYFDRNKIKRNLMKVNSSRRPIKSANDKPRFAVEISDYTGSVFDSDYFDSKSEAIKWANSENHHNGYAALYDNENEKLIKEWEITSSRGISSSKSNILADLNDMESEFEVVNYMKKVFDEHGKPELYEKFCEEVDNSDDVPGVVAEKYVSKIFNSRRLSSSQKGMENVVEGTKYDDYHIDTNGMGILSVENIIEEIEGRGNQAVLTVQSSDGSTNHSQFSSKDWKEYKDSTNDAGNAITDVWVTEVEGGSYVRNSRKITSSQEPLYWGDEHDQRGVNMYTREEYIEKYGEEPSELKRVTEVKTDLWNSRRPIESSTDTIHCVYLSDITPTEWTKSMALAAIKNSVTNYGYYEYNGKKGFCIVGDFDDIYNFIESVGHVVDEDDLYHWKEFPWDDAKKLDKRYSGQDYQNRKGLTNSRRPIKSGWVFISSIGDASIFKENNKYLVTLEKGANTVEEYFNDEASARDFAKEITSSFIRSARYIATDPESGEVLGSADTYEEAVNEWGEDVTITDSEAAEGQEDMGLFQSRKITSAVDGGWEVRSSDVPEALDLFVEYFGEEDALEEIAKAMGSDTLEENIDWIAQQWGFAEDIEELDDAWDKYETAKEIMGESELFNNLTQAAGYDELAEDLAFIFRMNDFREWDKYDNEDEDEEEYDDDDITEDGKGQAIFGLLYNIVRTENNLDAWSTGHYSKETSDKIFNLVHKLEDKLEDYYDYGMPSLLEEYESKGGTYSINDGDPDNGDFDNEEIAKEIFNRAIKRINEFEEWENAQENPDLDFAEWLEQNYPDEAITSGYSNSKKNNIISNNSFPVKTVKNILSGKWSEDYAAECIAQKQDINVGYARQILSSWIEQYKPKLIKSGVLDIAEDINTEFDIDGDLESWAEQYTNPEGKSNTVGGEMVRAAMQIIYRYNNDGDMIGRGYGNETVNAAARYITEKAEMGVNEQIQKWLDHEERADDYDYNNFIKTFTTEIEQILRENPELFQKPNNDDYWDWKEDEDMDYGFDECYLDDGDGNQYWFQLDNDRWTCTGIELDPNAVTYSEGDTINEGDEYSDEIDRTEEFGSFEADGFIYEYAGDDWDDEREEYTSWQITKVVPEDPYCDEGDTLDFYDLEPDELSGFRLFDNNGNEIDERTFLANSLIKSAFFAGDEGEVIIEINNNGKWEFVSLDNTPEGWSTKKNAKVFKSEDAARSSALMKRLEQAGYSEDVGNLRISVR